LRRFIQIVAAGTVLDEALVLASRIADLAPVSAQLTKQLIDAAAGEGFAASMEAMAGALAASTQDAGEGLASFQEKRKPQFRGM